MSTLIIFLFLILLILMVLVTYKAPIVFKLNIENDNLDFEYKAFFKERHIKNKVSGFLKSGSAEFDKNILVDVSEVIDIENFRTNILISTPIIEISNVLVLFFSWLVPSIYRLPFAKKEGLYFKVLPGYNEWRIKLDIEGEIRVDILSILIIIFKMKKRIKKVWNNVFLLNKGMSRYYNKNSNSGTYLLFGGEIIYKLVDLYNYSLLGIYL